jgi:hypothetical protein
MIELERRGKLDLSQQLGALKIQQKEMNKGVENNE